MAVQLTTSTPQDFLQVMMQGASQEASQTAAAGKGEAKESFANLLKTFKKMNPDANVKSWDKVVRAVQRLSEEELLRLVEPLANGNGQDELAAFADMMGINLESGEIGEAIRNAEKAFREKSRFDPDAILGLSSNHNSLHKAIQALIDKVEGLEDEEAGKTGEKGEDVLVVNPGVQLPAAPDDEDAALGDASEAEATIVTADADAEEPAQLPEEPAATAGEAASGDSAETGLAASATPPERTAKFAEALRSLEQAAAPATEGTAKDAPAQPAGDEASDDEVGDALQALRDMIANRTDKDGEQGDTGVREDGFQGRNGMRQREQEDRKAAGNASSRARSAAASAANAREAAGSSLSESFAGDLAAAANAAAKQDLPAENRLRSTAESALPGSTYLLEGEDAFGDGITSVLEFMRNDETTEAHIVVEPPALGRIDVSLQASASGMEAVFKVDSEPLKQMLQQQLDSLKASLQAQGIHVSGLAVDIKNKDEQKGRGDLYGTGKRIRRIGGVAAEDGDLQEGTKLARLDLEKGLLHWVA